MRGPDARAWHAAGGHRARTSSTSAASPRSPRAPSRCTETEELRRVLPVARGPRRRKLKRAGSRSTPCPRRSSPAPPCEAGAGLVNDVTALRGDPQMADLVAESGAECCLMHMLGSPARCNAGRALYADVVDDVKAFLEERLRFAVARRDPRAAHPARPRDRVRQDRGAQPPATATLARARRARPPAVVGTSRKSFLGRVLADPARRERAGRRRRTAARDARRPACSPTSAARVCCASTMSPGARGAGDGGCYLGRAMDEEERRGPPAEPTPRIPTTMKKKSRAGAELEARDDAELEARDDRRAGGAATRRGAGATKMSATRAWRRSRSRSAGSRSTPTTGSATPSARSASG